MRPLWRRSSVTALLATIALSGCGGVAGSKFAYIAPSGVTLQPSGSVQFVAACSIEIVGVEWSADDGSLSPAFSNGRFIANYVAPASPGVYFVEARIETDEGNYFANAMILVQ